MKTRTKNVLISITFLCGTLLALFIYKNHFHFSTNIPQQKERAYFCQKKSEKSSCIIIAPEYFAELKNIASNHDLILLDLDDVTLTTEDYICGNVFLNKLLQEHKAINGNIHLKQKIIDRSYDCLDKAKHIPVSKKLISDFASITNKNIFGLTARKVAYADETIKQVNKVGMQFSDSKNINHPLIKHGIIFAGANPKDLTVRDKGKVLQELISKGYFGDVKSVFFMDDSLRNIKNVKKALDKNIIFTGINLTTIKEKTLRNVKEKKLNLLVKEKFHELIKQNRIAINENYKHTLARYNNSSPSLSLPD